MAATRLFASAAMMLAAAAICACIEVPDNVRAHFAETRAGEHSNFRKGPKGTAPSEPAPAAQDAGAAAPDVGSPDGGAS
jgi:hypothetical protein